MEKKSEDFSSKKLMDHSSNTLLDTTLNKWANSSEMPVVSRDRKIGCSSLKQKYIDKLENCGNYVVALQCRDCGHIHYGKIACGLRTCYRCAQRRADIVYFEVLDTVKKLKGFRLRFITFGYGIDKSMREGIKESKQAFRKIWHNVLELKGKTGAVVAVEVGSQKKSVHLHCLYYGPYIPQEKLKAEWERLTGKWYVDIRLVKGAKRGIRETLKYIAKGVGDFSYDEGYEIEKALKGMRRVMTYGVLYKRVTGEERSLVCVSCGGISFRYMGIFGLDMIIIRDRGNERLIRAWKKDLDEKQKKNLTNDNLFDIICSNK